MGAQNPDDLYGMLHEHADPFRDAEQQGSRENQGESGKSDAAHPKSPFSSLKPNIGPDSGPAQPGLPSGWGFAYKPRLPDGFSKVATMKKGIHPNYHFVNVVLNDGTTYRTRTTWGEPDQKLQLDIDPTTHPAWTGGQQQLVDRGGRLTRFNKRFKDYVKS